MTEDRLAQIFDGLKKVIEANQPPPITCVGPSMLADIIAYEQSERLLRRRRAEALWTAVGFKLLSIQTGKKLPLSIRHHLGEAAGYRRALSSKVSYAIAA